MISIVIPHYNSSDLAAETIGKVLKSAALEQIQVEIVVVDDGSSGVHRSHIAQLASEQVRVVLGERNLGRSGAINLGVSESAHELVLVLDCDCQPGSNSYFSRHLQAITAADVGFGGLLKVKNDFWGKYQDLAVKRRIKQFNAGKPFSFTTTNMLIRKHVFQSVDGYDEAYRHYGFEDRDLLIRLQKAGARFVYSSCSPVFHCDTRISLTSVVKKMREAGQYTSGVFSARHPEAYRSLGYARVDASHHPALRLISGVNAEWLAYRIDPWLDRIPFPFGVAMTRAVTALAYLGGTAEVTSSGAADSSESPN